MFTIIHGSHRHGYHWNLVKRLQDYLEKTEVEVKIIDLAVLNFEYCCGDQVCQEKECIYKDDELSKIFEQFIIPAAGIYMVTPTYFNMPPARLKNMMDRSNAILPHIDENQRRYFGAWVCGETEDSSIDSNLKLLINFAEICGMQPVNDLMIKEISEQEEPCKVSLDKTLKIAELIKDLHYSNE